MGVSTSAICLAALLRNCLLVIKCHRYMPRNKSTSVASTKCACDVDVRMRMHTHTYTHLHTHTFAVGHQRCKQGPRWTP
eukprot:753234-Pelagomonas_calceolata.AAC.5